MNGITLPDHSGVSLLEEIKRVRADMNDYSAKLGFDVKVVYVRLFANPYIFDDLPEDVRESEWIDCVENADTPRNMIEIVALTERKDSDSTEVVLA